MQKILFVCLGNICRSPLAEGIMMHLKKEHHLAIEIDSAGTSNYHIDEGPDKRTIQNALKNGIDLRELRARQFEVSDFDKFDKIFVMDNSNLQNILSLSTQPNHANKVQLLLSQTKNATTLEVPDPYFGGEQGFETVFKLVYEACEAIRIELDT